jgi:hypothetical protein
MVFIVSVAHVLSNPAITEVNAIPDSCITDFGLLESTPLLVPVPNLPFSFLPQQYNTPFVVTAHV